VAHTFQFQITVVTERESGKFMSREEQETQIQEALESADPGSLDGGPDGDSMYSVVDWAVEAIDQKK
jgi:hypothetical protein